MVGFCNGIAGLWPPAGLEALDPGANRIHDQQPQAALARLRLDGNCLGGCTPAGRAAGPEELGLGRNVIGDLGSLAGLDRLSRLDLRGSAVGHLRPLRGLTSLAWVHVGAIGIGAWRRWTAWTM